MDAETRFTLGANDFARLIGPKTAAVLNRPWAEIAATLKLDSQGQIAHALAARDTWSGIVVHWPLDNGSERLAVEMSGLPVFDRDRKFEGFRGFGICRGPAKRDEAAPPAAPAANVVNFQPAPPVTDTAPPLTAGEHSAFEELARELNARLKNSVGKGGGSPAPDEFDLDHQTQPFTEHLSAPSPAPAPPKAARNGDATRDTSEGRPILDRLPIGLLVYRLNNLIYANRAFLDWTGYPTLEALTEAGGLDSLFIETNTAPGSHDAANGKTLTIATVNGKQKPVEGRLFSVSWNSENALVLMINTQTVSDERGKAAEASLRRVQLENHELSSILDTATDGVLVLDRAGRVLSANRSAQALFGYDSGEFSEMSIGELFAPESRRAVQDLSLIHI